MNTRTTVWLTLLFISPAALTMPKITVTHQRTVDDYAQIQVTNDTNKKLACSIAIDGYKIKFRLMPQLSSIWYKATDKRFNHTHFSVWCDYLALHPSYQNN